MGTATSSAWRATKTLALGTAGALIARALRIPAADLVGPAVTVAIAAMLGADVSLPRVVRDFAFASIGISIGSNLTSETLVLMSRWPLSLAALFVCVAVTTLLSHRYLTRVAGWDRQTALLSCTPGALSMAIAYAADGYGDARAISLSQTLRNVSLTICLPLLLGGTGTPAPSVNMSRAALGALLLGTVVAGTTLNRLHAPTPVLLGGMLVTGASHLLGATSGHLPAAATVPAFVITGTFVGSRFSGVTRRDLWEGLGSSGVVVLITTSVSALFAVAVAHQLRLPFAQTWVAFAPGGAEAMTAMAIALGYDQAYIGSHHVFRILLLSASLPVALGRASGSSPSQRRPGAGRATGPDGLP